MKAKLLVGLLVLGVIIGSVCTILFFGVIQTPGPGELTFQFERIQKTTCEINEEKNKVAVVIAKDGIYDSNTMDSQVSAYYEAITKDSGMKNVGLKKFDGITISELDNFIDDLYVKEDVAYVILIGDDLPVADVTEDDERNLAAIWEKLSCVNGSCGYKDVCRDLAISYISPPFFYPNNDKVDFVLKILEKYIDYHTNFDFYSSKYPKLVLHIEGKYLPNASEQEPLFEIGYDLPIITVVNTDGEKVRDSLNAKSIVLYYGCGDPRSMGVHGSPTSVEIGLSHYGISTTLEEYSNFTKEYGTPALLVQAGSCGAFTIKKDGINYCCWPQIYMESGVWAYYNFGGGEAETKIPRMQRAFSNEKSIGLAIRKNIIGQIYIFGDILAHMK